MVKIKVPFNIVRLTDIHMLLKLLKHIPKEAELFARTVQRSFAFGQCELFNNYLTDSLAGGILHVEINPSKLLGIKRR